MLGSPVWCPQQLQPSSPACLVALHPSSLCCLPSTPQHKRGRWQPQTGKTCGGGCCRQWTTSTCSGRRGGTDPSCRWHLCWLTSPVYCPDELLSTCRFLWCINNETVVLHTLIFTENCNSTQHPLRQVTFN